MKKNLTFIISIIMLLFVVYSCGQGETTQDSSDKDATVIQSDSEPTSPREELEVEVAPGVYSLQELMRVHFIDVGQADSIFIELGNGQTMLIDAGRSSDASTIINYIRNLQYNSIDFVIATHPHDDHIGGMADVINSFEIGKMYMPKQAHTISVFENMLDVIENKGIELYTAKAGVKILSSGIIEIDVLAPLSDSASDLNNCSAVIRLTYGDTVMLFMGDAGQEIEEQILDSNIDADVLKVGHHGAETASSKSFINAVSPSIAVISVGESNSYGHPDTDTLVNLNVVGADIYRTDEVGTVIVTADHNKKITVDKKTSTVKENAPPVVVPIEQPKEEQVTSDNQSQIVYRTRTGSKYHQEGCSYLKSKIETTVEEAKAIGLGPCSRCLPPR